MAWSIRYYKMKKGKTMPIDEKIRRAYKARIRFAKTWCEANDAKLLSFQEAESFDICIIAMSDYDLHEFRKDIVNEETYFLNVEDYEKWSETED